MSFKSYSHNGSRRFSFDTQLSHFGVEIDVVQRILQLSQGVIDGNGNFEPWSVSICNLKQKLLNKQVKLIKLPI